jgi:hypothetical protein
MKAQLELAFQQHPGRGHFEELTASFSPTARRDFGVRFEEGGMLTLREGRTMYKVRNCIGSLLAHAESVRKCPGWNGKNTPKPRRGSAGITYRHPQGFVLCIPDHLAPPDDFRSFGGAESVTLGQVVIKLHHASRTLSGDVPASWLIDLNADSAVVTA